MVSLDIIVCMSVICTTRMETRINMVYGNVSYPHRVLQYPSPYYVTISGQFFCLVCQLIKKMLQGTIILTWARRTMLVQKNDKARFLIDTFELKILKTYCCDDHST